jgi:hypothetical protein
VHVVNTGYKYVARGMLRTLLALLGGLLPAACAAAGAAQGPADSNRQRLDANVSIDAPMNQTDGGVDDAPRSIDAPAEAIDAPAVMIDAPAASCATPFTGVLATWSFSGQSGEQTSTAASATATGVTAGAIERSSDLTPTSGSNSINSSGWSESGSRSSSLYYTFTVTPAAGCELDVTGMAIEAHSSASGPESAEVATSADTFASNVTISTSTSSSPTLSVSDSTAAVELRVYGYNASSDEGTMRIETTLTVSGALH